MADQKPTHLVFSYYYEHYRLDVIGLGTIRAMSIEWPTHRPNLLGRKEVLE